MTQRLFPANTLKGHALEGRSFVYRINDEPYDPATDMEPGLLIVGNGMPVKVISVFRDWNGVEGLDMLYVQVHQTGYNTHVTPKDLGITTAI